MSGTILNTAFKFVGATTSSIKLRLLTSPGYLKEGVISCVGDMAANLLRQGVTLGISSRGVGSLTKNGEYNEVQEDFELICFDLV